jgi:hypothetical protein
MQENETAATAAAEENTEITETTEAPAAEPTAETTEETPTENTTEQTATAEAEQTPEEQEEITYHAVQKDGSVTAIWEMQGQKHLRTIDPRSREGLEILRLFTEEEGEEAA